MDAAQCAADIDPWRENSMRLLLRAHVAVGENLRAAQLLADFSDRLRREFGVDPSPGLASLLPPPPAGRAGTGRQAAAPARLLAGASVAMRQ